MRRVVVLLRGVNVSGRNKVTMAELRADLTNAGYLDVATLIQSGNIAITTADGIDDIVNIVSDILHRNFDVTVPVIGLDQTELEAIAERASFDPDGDPSTQLVYFVSGDVNIGGVDALDPDRFPGDTIRAASDAIYVEYGGGQSTSKLTLNHLEKASGVNVTGRNLKTVAKLRTL